MSTIEELRQIRIKKLENLKNSGINPYPSKVRRSNSIESIVNKFGLLSLLKKEVYLAGRIKTLRVHGKAAFFDIENESGKIQCFISAADFPISGKKNLYDIFLNDFDIGDLIEAGGKLFKTGKGEKTVKVSSFEMAAKALRPLPEKWHGLKDIEERYRKRYLDLLMNPKIKEKFIIRSKIIEEIRNFLSAGKFIEFETPVLQIIPGGAAARPFKTHLNAMDVDLYLRIAPELYLKRLIIGGFEKIYEIGRNFRNEGVDASHNPEFTMLETYIAYQDSSYLKEFIKNMLDNLVRKINGGNSTVEYQGNKINFNAPWKEKKYESLIKEFGEFDIAKKNLIQPTLVSGFPAGMLPLAKTLEKDPAKADAFQVFIGGLELIKAFAELNDPLEQRKRFEKQEELRMSGEEETQRFDEDFLEAMEYGMPPTAGFGLGLDRLAMLLTDSHAAREIILFPTMKPKE